MLHQALLKDLRHSPACWLIPPRLASMRTATTIIVAYVQIDCQGLQAIDQWTFPQVIHIKTDVLENLLKSLLKNLLT
jgi:hypothetical protein